MKGEVKKYSSHIVVMLMGNVLSSLHEADAIFLPVTISVFST